MLAPRDLEDLVHLSYYESFAPDTMTEAERARLLELRADAPACTGYLDEQGHRNHDGDTCPVHEAPARRVVVRLVGGDLDGVEARTGVEVEVRQYHRDFQEAASLSDEHGRYEVVHASERRAVPGHDAVLRAALLELRSYAEGDATMTRLTKLEARALLEAASGAARVTAGSPPGRAEHRGVLAWATLEDNPDSPRHVVVRFYLDPPPRGLDGLVYSHHAVPAPEGPRVG